MENPFGNLDKETQEKIQQAQILEQNFQQVMQQKQMFNMELNETDFSIAELEKAEGEVFKIVGGQIVIKSTKEKLMEDMKNKKELIEKRLEAMSNQEKEFSDKMEELRTEIMGKISHGETPVAPEDTPSEEDKKTKE